MVDEDINFPKVNYGKKNVDRIHELTIADWSPFFDHGYWEIFIFCMSYAYVKGLKPEKVPGTATMPADAFKTETRHLMRALAIDYKNDISVIKNSRDYVTICEQFAYVGFDEVYNMIKNRPSEKAVDSVLFDMINEANKN